MAATEKVKATRGKKGDGPLAISYLAGDKAIKRVSDDVSALTVTPKTGSAKNYNLTELPAAVILQLAALGAHKRMDVYARNGVKGNDGANVVELTDKVWNDLKEGKIYTRNESAGGGGAGRPFPFEHWQEVMADTVKRKGKPALSEAQLAAFKVKLEGMTSKDRQIYIRKLHTDKVFALASKLASAKADAAKLKANKPDADSFDVLGEL